MRLLASLMIILSLVACSQPSGTGEAVPLPVPLEPPVFEMASGAPVKSRDAWAERRAELKSLFQAEQYGSMPPAPEHLKVREIETRQVPELGVLQTDYIITMRQGEQEIDLPFRLERPLNAEGDLPVFIMFGYGGGDSQLPDWWPAETEPNAYTKNGYATVRFIFGDVAADNAETYKDSGVYQLFGADMDTGVLMGWAWGISRVIDALEDIDGIRQDQIAVSGFSRLGKAALVAGAFDERIALTAANHSGTGGAAPYKQIFGEAEQLENIAGWAHYWFQPGFYDYADKVETLPIDQHLLKALIAPRALFTTEGTLDNWTNPEGAQMTQVAAQRVFRCLGAEDKLGTRYRDTGHEPAPDDVVAFANYVFRGAPLPDDDGQPYGFNELPYPTVAYLDAYLLPCGLRE